MPAASMQQPAGETSDKISCRITRMPQVKKFFFVSFVGSCLEPHITSQEILYAPSSIIDCPDLDSSQFRRVADAAAIKCRTTWSQVCCSSRGRLCDPELSFSQR